MLASAAAGNHLRLADLQTADGDRVIRFQVNAPDDPVYLVPGTILRLDNGALNEYAVVESVAMEFITLSVPPPLVTYRVTLRNGVANDYGLAPGDPALDATSREFDLTVQDLPTVENYHFLSVDPLSPRYYGLLVNGHSRLVTLAPAQPPDSHLPPDNLPDGTLGLQNLAGGLDEVLTGLLPNDYQNGLDALVNLEVDIVAIPDRQDATVQGYLIDHCQGVPPKAGNRFAILDSQPGAPITGAGSVADQIAPLAGNGLGFAALYYPWVIVPPAPPAFGAPPPPVAPPNVLVPPSGHIAGVYARTDNSRGVHKAPAGIEANLNGTIGVERVLGDTEQGLLEHAPVRHRRASASSAAASRPCGARARTPLPPPTRTGSTSTFAGCSCTSKARSQKESASRFSSRTTSSSGARSSGRSARSSRGCGVTERSSARRQRTRSTSASTRR